MTNTFEEYLERFCEEYRVSREEALNTKIVKEVQNSYFEDGVNHLEES